MRATARAWNDATEHKPFCELFFFLFEASARSLSNERRQGAFLFFSAQPDALLPAGNDHFSRKAVPSASMSKVRAWTVQKQARPMELARAVYFFSDRLIS